MTFRTYVPYPSFTRCALVLDDDLLGTAAHDALTVVYAVWQRDVGGATSVTFERSDDVQRWTRHGGALVQYARALVEEYDRRRGERSTQVRVWLASFADRFTPESWQMPAWYGDGSYHADERDRLRGMNPGWFVGRLSPRTVATDARRCPACDVRYGDDPDVGCQPPVPGGMYGRADRWCDRLQCVVTSSGTPVDK